jgi:hypothetical protein
MTAGYNTAAQIYETGNTKGCRAELEVARVGFGTAAVGATHRCCPE